MGGANLGLGCMKPGLRLLGSGQGRNGNQKRDLFGLKLEWECLKTEWGGQGTESSGPLDKWR